MNKLAEKIERVKIMKSQADLTRNRCYADPEMELRIEKIALSNIIIDNANNIIAAHHTKNMKKLDNYFHEYECILEVAASVIYEGLIQK